MRTPLTQIQPFKKGSDYCSLYRSGVSLHSHTMHSRESLRRLPLYIDRFPIGGYILERELGRLHLYHGWNFDFAKYYWTPPLSPREAFELESNAIEQSVGLNALVSLSDHDNIEAGQHLRLLAATQDVPISVEWTAPFGDTILHLGVHNLPAPEATNWIAAFQQYTKNPHTGQLVRLLTGLNACPSVLIVLNHPYWSAENIAPDVHLRFLKLALEKYSNLIHAVEMNGMRSRRENREVVALGEAIGLPMISGGDRHGCEPNATVNLTGAATFDEFVAEIREERRSEVLLMPQYFEPLPLRLIENAWHALSDAPGEFGRGHWMARVFFEQNGEAQALSQFTGTRFHHVVDKFRWVISLVANPVLRLAVRLPFLGHEEGGL